MNDTQRFRSKKQNSKPRSRVSASKLNVRESKERRRFKSYVRELKRPVRTPLELLRRHYLKQRKLMSRLTR